MVVWNTKIIEIGRMNLPGPIKTLLRLPFMERMVAETVQSFTATPISTGSVDIALDGKCPTVVY